MNDNTALNTILTFVDNQLCQWKKSKQFKKSPLYIFISGPQGSGKSYSSKKIGEHITTNYSDISSLAISIDDFYLKREDQIQLQNKYSNNKLLDGRGLPGTHDLPLLSQFVESTLSYTNSSLNVPHYDKSKYGGLGDRAPTSTQKKLPIDVIIFEGWFVGYESISRNMKKTLDENMIDINKYLLHYSKLLWDNDLISSIGIVFATNKIHNVYNWRKQQERELIEQTGNGMTDEQVEKFIDRYWPCYEEYFEDFIKSKKLGNIATLTVTINIDRNLEYSEISLHNQ
ncbi:hypothetical protein TBLA_0B09920 [Henningerozyma blattae CBS 6284]|uniref:Phosphoribulokinase/uridine kinase domain-containing protein n=1 Tax=Henningerozyma blattae (strain ATCC 34711 / CBS 6284 / DSM 70876 / NBRC 10599 / NRRL Y-10934 / UCD 77-7) TaxID=1071380 RepID=I2H0A8_HENB6|nr:hypothetical protein TBLA_0B09920 [Tetrapisispora blattae CBS 6284]CCH59810.1 hypothetical protein TBLA_0B09920 [Tetrapisispora blattae CBS 6284]